MFTVKPDLAVNQNGQYGAVFVEDVLWKVNVNNSGILVPEDLAHHLVVEFGAVAWRDSRLYYWMIDDITFKEGFNNDLQMLFSEVDYDNGTDNPEGFFWSVPKTQISGYNIHSIVRNFGNLEQWGTHMNVQVTKNNQVIFNQNTPEFLSYPLQVDTLRMPGQFIPGDFGHYRIDLTIEAEEDDEIPHDNGASVPNQVSDSLFSRCDNTPETSFSTWAWYEQPHEGDVMGVWYTLKSDIEISSVSAYIRYVQRRDHPLMETSGLFRGGSFGLHPGWPFGHTKGFWKTGCRCA